MQAFEARCEARHALQAATLRLLADFDDLPPDVVIRCVGGARERLLSAGVRQGLAERAEAMARESLPALARPHALL